MNGLDDRNPDVSKWMLGLPAEAQRSGTASLILDHVAKSKENRGRWAIGAQAKLAAVRGSAYSMAVRRPFGVGLVGSAVLTVTKDRPGQVRPRTPDRKSAGTFLVDSTDPDRIVARIEPAPEPFEDGLSHTQRRVLDMLPERPEGAIGWRAIGDRLKQQDPDWPLKRTTILDALGASSIST